MGSNSNTRSTVAKRPSPINLLRRVPISNIKTRTEAKGKSPISVVRAAAEVGGKEMAKVVKKERVRAAIRGKPRVALAESRPWILNHAKELDLNQDGIVELQGEVLKEGDRVFAAYDDNKEPKNPG